MKRHLDPASSAADRTQFVERVFARLREGERIARARLEEGCTADLAMIPRFIEGPLVAAKREALDELLGLGRPENADLARALRSDAFERIAMRCAELVFANASLRFRARFKMYAEEFLKIEAMLLEALASEGSVRAKHLLPRIFSVGHLTVENLHVPPGPADDSQSEIVAWTERLRACIQDALLVEIAGARRAVLASGHKRLAIVRVRLSMALRNATQPAGS